MDNGQFSTLELQRIDKADDLKISPLRWRYLRHAHVDMGSRGGWKPLCKGLQWYSFKHDNILNEKIDKKVHQQSLPRTHD